MTPPKLQCNRDWVADWERGNAGRLSAIALVYIQLNTPKGGREHRPLARLTSEERERLGSLPLFIAPPHIRYPKYIRIDPQRCVIDYQEGTVQLPVTKL